MEPALTEEVAQRAIRNRYLVDNPSLQNALGVALCQEPGQGATGGASIRSVVQTRPDRPTATTRQRTAITRGGASGSLRVK